MKKADKPGEQVEYFRKRCDVSKEEKREKPNNQTRFKKKTKKRRNAFPLSYIQVISYAILSSPQKRVTLAEIYDFIQNNYPSFTENRVRWKNTVRHNLSLHECFQRGEIAMHKAGCYWRIHPSFLAEFSRGNFSTKRRSMCQNPPLTSTLLENHIAVERPCFPCCIHQPNPPFSVAPIAPLTPLYSDHRHRGFPVTYADQVTFLPSWQPTGW